MSTLDTDETQIVPPASSNGHGDGPSESLLDSLRARRTALEREHVLHVLVPGYDGQLALRTGPVDARAQTRLVERATSSTGLDTWATNADLLVAATREIVVRRSYDDPWKSLGPDGEALGLGDALVELLRLSPRAKTARETLRSLFALAASPEFAITSASAQYVEWASEADDEIDEQYRGESQGAGK